MSTKIIFLDIDGVLITPRTMAMTQEVYQCWDNFSVSNAFDPVGCALIKRICETFDVKIVISSTMRKDFKVLSRALNVHKLIDYLHDSDYVTPVLGTSRGEEIDEWLKNHKDVDKYAILDDDSDMLPDQKDNFVFCDRNVGISHHNYIKLKTIFQ